MEPAHRTKMSSLYAWVIISQKKYRTINDNSLFQGANSHGQLGLGFNSEMCTTPQKVDAPLGKITQIKGGGGHCLFLNDLGHIYACGWNNKGQLGIISVESDAAADSVPHISAIEPSTFGNITIVQIECGWDCSAAIGQDGSIFVWGSNLYEQLGIGGVGTTKTLTAPHRFWLPDNDRCLNIKFGLRITAIVTSRYLYFVGAATSKIFTSMASSSSSSEIEWQGIRYLRILRNGDVDSDRIACGQKHVIFMGEFGLQAFGDNKFGQCNTDGVVAEKICALQAGWTHNGILYENGEVWLWGRNNYGQIGWYIFFY